MFWFKSRKEEQKDLPQYQRDFDLSPQGDHYMFWEYLEVGKFFSYLLVLFLETFGGQGDCFRLFIFLFWRKKFSTIDENEFYENLKIYPLKSAKTR